MILLQQKPGHVWFSWDTETRKHYYPDKDFRLRGPTHWNLEHNLNNGTTAIGPNILGRWDDE